MKDSRGLIKLLALPILTIACFSLASAETKKVILFPVTNEGNDSEEFGWDSALSKLAESLEEELGSGFSLVPEHRVTLLCQEFWRNHSDWSASEARHKCESKLRADYSVGVEVTRFNHDVDDRDERRTACTGQCDSYVGQYVDAFGRVWPRLVTFYRCNYEESPFVLHEVTAEAELEVHFFVYDVNKMTTLLSRQKRLRSNKTSKYAEAETDASRLRECPQGSLTDSPTVTQPLAGVPFRRRGPIPDAHELLWGQWRQFTRTVSGELQAALGIRGQDTGSASTHSTGLAEKRNKRSNNSH